jgi:hypothetical protein
MKIGYLSYLVLREIHEFDATATSTAPADVPPFGRVRICGRAWSTPCQFHGIDLVGRHQCRVHRIRQLPSDRQLAVIDRCAVSAEVEIGTRPCQISLALSGHTR